MSAIFPHLPTNLGVYSLTRLLGTHETCDRYLARQSHVDRSVVIEVLRPESPQELLDAFLRSARARVAAQLPHVSQVLESMVSGKIWYITSECPEGTPLSTYVNKEENLTTPQACKVIEQAGYLYDLCARKGLSAGVLTPDMIFITNEGEVSFLSPVTSGTPTAELHNMQLDGLAATMQQVRPVGEAGQTRVATLLEWLGQEFEGQRMDWQAVSATAEFISEQVQPMLSKANVSVPVVESSATRRRRMLRKRQAIIKVSIAVVAAALVVAAISLIGLPIADNIEVEPIPAVQSDYVHCRAGEGEARVAVMSAPVSIRDYNKFLEEYDQMPQRRRDEVNAGLPVSEPDHTPLDWNNQMQAAFSNGKWHGKELSADSPVCGVSYWDAMAYANYRHGALPSLQLLYTARKANGSNACEEWTTTVRPEDPLYVESHLVLPANSGTPQLECDQKRRNLNRGFRLVFPASH